MGCGSTAATLPPVPEKSREEAVDGPSSKHKQMWYCGAFLVICACFTSLVQVGDYVLSPEMVVERKALPDLFASLNSGR